MTTRALGWLVGVLAVALAAAIALVVAWPSSPSKGDLGPPRRSGPPALVGSPSLAPMLWLLTRREERVSRWQAVDGERTRVHFDLHAHDPRTAERRWSRRLLTVPSGGHGATARLLGLERDVVWVFLRNQLVALSARDGSVLATSINLTEASPGLAPMWPSANRSFTFDGAMIVTTADALHWRIEPHTWRATAYRPENDENFRRAQFMSADWNGTYRTGDFLTRQLTDHEGRWIGLFSDREAADAVNDGFGDHHKNPERVTNEGATARRSFRVATVGKTKAFSEGRHDRLMALAPAGDGATYLQGGLLKEPGVRAAMQPGADGGAIVIHRDRIDDAGRLQLTRVLPTLRQRWTVALPIGELHARWELAGSLLLFGSAAAGTPGAREQQEFVVAVDLEQGTAKRFAVERERAE